MIFYDFEIFSEDWLVVCIDMTNKKEHVIINDVDELEKLYEEHKNDIWCGFNSRFYDQWILKAILCGLNPKKLNDFIIVKGQPGYKFSSLLRNIPLNNYDVMNSLDKGLKFFEGSMGNDIKESSVPFDIDRKLTDDEIAETVKYCKHDVEQTIEVFLQRKDDFEAHLGLVKLACEGKPLNLSLISKTKTQLASIILDAKKQKYDDEFDIDFPSTLKIEKYTEVLEWYKNPKNMCYARHIAGKKTLEKTQLNIMVAGVPHQFGWGGVHGAIDKYSGEGYFINMDVASLYPSLMIQYNLHSRSIADPKKYEEIYHQRLKYKAEKNPKQAPLKLVLNSTYGAMKDENNDLYDPRQANRVCIYGQLLLLDLIEKLEPHCQIIQSNTDGVLVKLNSEDDYDLIDDIAYEWEQRTHLQLEFDVYKKIYQKDVNNYIIVDFNGKYKSKGAYVKKLSNLDYDLPIVNKALIDYMVKNIPIEKTILECDKLKEFQQICKITSKYKHILHGDRQIKEKCIRIFASTWEKDKGVQKVHATTDKPAKIPNSPEKCFMFNGNMCDIKTNDRLDKNWYINVARKRLNDFGVI